MLINPKKSLGQNWLTSTGALDKIIQAGNISKSDLVLEIGPGLGVLTQKLLDQGAKVVAVEKDARLISVLEAKFDSFIKTGQLTLIEGDILELEVKTLIKNNSYKLIANIPYYITGQIFKKFLSHDNQPDLLVLLVQKEVADSRTGHNSTNKTPKESFLYLSVKVYGQPHYVATVKKGSFNPPPKVDSAILLIDKISKDFFTDNKINEADFFDLIKKGFKSKRKLLKSNLEITEEVLIHHKINPLARAEDLSLDEWNSLAKTILN